MVCGKCGKVNKDTAMFCIQCGSPLKQGTSTMPGNQTIYPPVVQRKKNKGMLIGIIITIIIFMILLVVSGIIISKKGLKGKESSTEATTEQVLDNQQTVDTQAPTTEAPIPPTTEAPPSTQAPAPPSTEAPAPASSNDYIIPYSSSTLITEADIMHLSKNDLRLARNEIYARHGRMFKDQGLQNYFLNKSWYRPTITPEDFDLHEDTYLTEIEKKNKDVIVNFERKMGYTD